MDSMSDQNVDQLEPGNQQDRQARQIGTVITIENQYGRYQVAVKRGDLSITDIMNDCVIPVLIAAGYSEQTLKDLLAL